MSRKLGIAYHDLFLKHDAGPTHPETGERVGRIMEAVRDASWIDQAEIVEARSATPEEVALVHDPKYVEAMRRLCEAGGEYLASMESNVDEDSYDAALRAAGAGLTLADGVMEGRWDLGFGPVRPPGHHAIANRPRGFCIFNNIAIMARYLMERYSLKRIAIFDFDVHHGNGSETTFYAESDVLYCSIHRDNLFPYDRGKRENRGVDHGEGFTLNVPMPRGSDDVEYLRVIDEEILPRIVDHNPEIVLVSAGFDAHSSDILGGMSLSTQGFADIAARIVKMAADSPKGRIITMLEGGYAITALAESVTAYLGRLLQD